MRWNEMHVGICLHALSHIQCVLTVRKEKLWCILHPHQLQIDSNYTDASLFSIFSFFIYCRQWRQHRLPPTQQSLVASPEQRLCPWRGGWLTWPPGFGCAGNQPSVVMIEGGTYSNQSCVEIARWLWLTWFSGCQRDCRCRVAIPTINCSGSIILMPFSLKQIQFVSANWDTYHSSLHWFLQTSKMCLRYSKYVIQHTRGATIVHDSVLKARMNFILAVLLNVRPYYLPRLVSVSASSKFFGIGCVMKYEKQSSFLWLCCLETVCSSTMFSGVVFC